MPDGGSSGGMDDRFDQILVEASLLDDVARNLPPLLQAVKLQKKAASVGFDWPSLLPVLAKMREVAAQYPRSKSTT